MSQFGKTLPILQPSRSPYAARIELQWAKLREDVEAQFPESPKLPEDKQAYLNHVKELYQFDAYHSLSIEGYRVSPELIQKVRNQGWHPDTNEEDQQIHQALAARGYFEAFNEVSKAIEAILNGENPAIYVRDHLSEWYQALWAPQIRANIIQPHHAIGYRRNPVYIRGSRHTPPPRNALMDAMDALFHCMEKEKIPAVRAILGHYLFVWIHPYPDGNGRIARF